MSEGPDHLRQARLRRGWSQEQAIVRFESIARVLAVEIPARSSLRTLLSMFENNRRAVPAQYRPVFRELYRATDDEPAMPGHQRFRPSGNASRGRTVC